MFLKIPHLTFEFKEHVLMFQKSSSAIVSVTLKRLQDNPYIFIKFSTPDNAILAFSLVHWI